MFKLDKSADKTFDFEFEGKAYSVPSVDSLPLSTYRAIRKAIRESGEQSETMFDKIMDLFDEYVPDVMERINLEDAKALFVAYSVNDDGASLGESSALSD